MSRLIIIHSSAEYLDRSRAAVASDIPTLDVRTGSSLTEVVGLIDDIAADALVLAEIQGTVRATVSALLPLRRARPRARFAIVGESGTRRDMQDCAAAGIAGFLLRDLPADRFIATLKLMLERREFIPATVGGIPVTPREMNGTSGHAAVPRPDLGRLTTRQRDVLKLVVLGMSNRDIAATLDIAEATVKVHVAAILRTLGLKTRGQAASVVMALSSDPEWARALSIETVRRPVVPA